MYYAIEDHDIFSNYILICCCTEIILLGCMYSVKEYGDELSVGDEGK